MTERLLCRHSLLRIENQDFVDQICEDWSGDPITQKQINSDP
jgi:hypothetical protein